MLPLILASALSITPTFEHIGYKKLITSEHKVQAPQVVYVHGRISESGAKSFAKDMLAAKKTGQPIIPIVISSYGGSVYALLEMIDTIKNIGVPVATIVKGKAMSAGAVLASCGDDNMRFISPNATFMIHEVSFSTWGKLEKIKTSTKEAERLNNMIMRIMAENIGKPSEYFIDMIKEKGHQDWYLNAEQAKEHGLVDHIRVPQVRVRVDVDVTIH
jgi:ATP-dependent Clp protease protease subunit